MQAQHPSGSATEATTNTLKVGDAVSYVVSRYTGHNIHLSVREGTIVEIKQNVAIVKSRNGRRSLQPLSEVTRKGERNALTKALLGER